MKIQIFNTLTRSIQEFTPVHPGEVTMYSCGPTVYNYAHIGNMRAFLFPDLLQRVLRVVGDYSMRWVMNITDIDDKTIRDSAPNSEAWRAEMGEQTNDPIENLRRFTEFYAEEFIRDIGMLGIRKEGFHLMPRATHYMAPMQDLIRKIAANGYAYARGGSIYFDVAKWRKTDKYGKLFEIDFDNFQAGVRIDADEYERENVSDFVLWKGHKQGEPSWDFDFNGEQLPGRPGWHIECSAMEYEVLGLPFDIHTGGTDLKFPHHEDEIAQSKAGYGIEPTNYWCHNEFLEIEGEKMSKSKGNFFMLRDLIQRGVDPIDVRWLMMSAHYASRLNFTFAGIESGRKARLRVQNYIYQLVDGNSQSRTNDQLPMTNHQSPITNDKSPVTNDLRNATFSELADDLNTPKALGTLFTFINQHPVATIPVSERASLLEFFTELNEIFDVWNIGKRPEEKLDIPAAVQALAEQRWTAKKARQFAEGDRLRDEIKALGFVVNDAKEGYIIEKV